MQDTKLERRCQLCRIVFVSKESKTWSSGGFFDGKGIAFGERRSLKNDEERRSLKNCADQIVKRKNEEFLFGWKNRSLSQSQQTDTA